MPDVKNAASASPPRARSGKRRRVTAGTLEQLRRELWYGVRRVSALLDDEDASPDLVIKASNALALVCNSYLRLTESVELQAEVRELQEDVKRLQAERGVGRNGWPA